MFYDEQGAILGNLTICLQCSHFEAVNAKIAGMNYRAITKLFNRLDLPLKPTK